MDKLIVTIAGITLIIFIYWFFFGKKPSFAKATEGQGMTRVVVDGGYTPSVIQIPIGKPTTLTFIRRDPNTCLEDFYIPDFKVKEYFPMNKPVAITLTPPTKGTFGFHCGMNMFHGKIIVV